MTKKIQFHVGKNHVNSRGVWTLTCPEKEKKQKKVGYYRVWTQDLWIPRPKLTLWATGIWIKKWRNCKIKKQLIRYVHCWFLLRFLVPNIFVLAIFSHVPPSSAKWDLYRIKVYLFRQLFLLYNFQGVPGTLFQNRLCGLYLLNHWANQ